MDIGYQTLPIRVGNSFVQSFEWEFDEGEGPPPDFTAPGKLVFRAEYGDQSYQLETDDGTGNLTILGPTSIRLRIPHSVTEDWVGGTVWAYELEWWDGIGAGHDEFTILEGDMPVSKRVNTNG